MNAQPILTIVICRRLAPILMVLLLVLVMRGTPAMVNCVAVRFMFALFVFTAKAELCNSISFFPF